MHLRSELTRRAYLLLTSSEAEGEYVDAHRCKWQPVHMIYQFRLIALQNEETRQGRHADAHRRHGDHHEYLASQLRMFRSHP